MSVQYCQVSRPHYGTVDHPRQGVLSTHVLSLETSFLAQRNSYGLFVCPALSKFLPRVGVRAARVEFSDIRTDAGFWIQWHNVTFLLGFFD